MREEALSASRQDRLTEAEVPAPFVSYAQHGEDVVLWRALGGRGTGTYVDVGAFDPTQDSVTRAFYERGWRGVNVEPQPGRLAAFERERPEDTNVWAALSHTPGLARLAVPDVAGWATIHPPSVQRLGDVRRVDVPQTTLAILLTELGITAVDFLKIDVEGAEADVVRGLNLQQVRPTVVVIEGVAPGVGRASGDEAVDILVRAGYQHCMFDGLNHYLTVDDSLVEALSVPANPLDEYQPSWLVDASFERTYLLARIHELEGAVAQELPHHHEVEPQTPAGPTVAMSAGEHDTKVLLDQMQRSGVSAAVRSSRRRLVLLEHISGPLLLHGVPSAPSAIHGKALPVEDALALSDPEDVVDALYRAVLGRPADDSGRRAWGDRLRHGDDAGVVALALLSSSEGRLLGDAHDARVRAGVDRWRTARILERTGVRVRGLPPHTEVLSRTVFVESLYHVVLRRLPTRDELEHELAKLDAGAGREWMVRAFARRPEAAELLLDRRRGGLRKRIALAVRRRLLTSLVRQLVVAAEQRELSRLLALAHPDPALPENVDEVS